MISLPRIFPNERLRFFVFALLMLINSIVVQLNGVVATSGFVSSAGPDQLLLVWAIDNLIIIAASGMYTLVIDRYQRENFASWLFAGAAVAYVLLYGLFTVNMSGGLSYMVLLILNDQQWILFPLLIWVLANDAFSVSETKRLFPLLALVTMLGGIIGNGIAASSASVQVTYNLMLMNAGMMLAMVVVLRMSLRHIKTDIQPGAVHESVKAVFEDGLVFIREIPAFRFLALSMFLVGVGLNTIEYHLIVSAQASYPDMAGLQAFYGLLRMVRMLSLLVVQGFVASWLISRLNFKSVFVLLPVTMLLTLSMVVLIPGLLVITLGQYLMRLVMEAVDDPARRSFMGMVPDETRGRISTFLNGYLYPVGSLISCGLIGLVIFLAQLGIMPVSLVEPLYLSLSGLLVMAAVFFIIRFRQSYDASMLNWRLRRRSRRNRLVDIDF